MRGGFKLKCTGIGPEECPASVIIFAFTVVLCQDSKSFEKLYRKVVHENLVMLVHHIFYELSEEIFYWKTGGKLPLRP